MTIHQRLATIMKKVGAIHKDGKVEFGKTKYSFRSLDAVINRVQPLFAEYGIFVGTKVVDSSIIEGRTKDGEMQFLCTVTVEYTFTADDGTQHVATAVGQAADKGDKGMAKAMSGAYKYAICQMLCIPYLEDDPDAHVPDRFRSLTSVTYTQHSRLKKSWVQSLGDNRPKREELESEFCRFVDEVVAKEDPEAMIDPLHHRTWTVKVYNACQSIVDGRLRELAAKAEGKNGNGK